MTTSEMLPSIALLIPQWPRQPITIRSAWSSLVKATISMSTAPILKMIRELHHEVVEGEGPDPG